MDAAFSAPVRDWFTTTFAEPTPPQSQGWPAIARGDHTLICAPTGSGKTLAAFLWSIDGLVSSSVPRDDRRCRVLYVSPLRALAVDVERNLRSPLRGIALAAERSGGSVHIPAVGMRTGDTPAAERRALIRRPPDILITTPESLYLMLTSAARETLRSVQTVIVDEIHAVAATKRGTHLALTLERLEAICSRSPQRIGLSATQRPLEEVARFLGGRTADGPRPVTIVDAGHRKALEIEVVVPVEDMADLDAISPEASQDPALAGQTRRSIWPAIHPELLALVRSHTSTLIFCNARRLAERLAARLNELAGEELVKAHHGSLAREQRLQIEDDLKSGRLRGLVATSSLELGIDMGAVDLVVQVESPGSVARGMQRIGRAGHRVGEPSRGKVFPKWRGDLLEAAVVSERMTEGLIESTRYPRNPLDVLAQHIVAMCAVDDWSRDDLAALVRSAAPYAELSDDVLDSVLDLLSGRYPSTDFAELRPRIVWDRRTGALSTRPGAHRLAVTNGGTIPDRGLFGVFTPEGRRVGELDEEMVYESRPGETFVLGASTWRIEDIAHDRVTVTPAPGEAGKLPFWRGDKPGRPLELGRAIGTFTRELRTMDREDALARLRERHHLDERAASNLLAYIEEQAEATGAVPDDRTIVVERFCDDIGDWRVCVLSPFGARVHAPWAIALQSRLAERGAHAQVLWSDDGIVVRLPEAEDTLPLEDLLVDPDEVESLVTQALASSAMFTSLFREAAGRALLLPRRRPGQRTPLWQQRQRASDLLSVALRYPAFPLLLETTRECLQDVFDVPALRDVLADLRSRRIKVVAADTKGASPFAQSLLFLWIAVYMYEYDAPAAERRAAALALDQDLLRELLGAEELRELIDADALGSLELELQHLSDHRLARSPDDVHDLLRTLGDLTAAEVTARSSGDADAWLRTLRDAHRVVALGIAGEERFAASEDAARYRDALGAALPPGLPTAFTEAVEAPLRDLVSRYARTHGPFHARDIAARWAIAAERVAPVLTELEGERRIVLGEFRPGGSEREWCDAGVLRLVRRRSLAALRREVEPVDAAALGRFLPAWQSVTQPRQGPDALAEAIGQLQGTPIPASVLESDVLPTRVAGYRPADLDLLCASGALVWVGAGSLGPRDGKVQLYFRDRLGALRPAPSDPPQGAVHDAIRAHLAHRGASFWPDLVAAARTADEALLLGVLWDLVWAGEVTNDTFAPLRALGWRRRSRPRDGRARPERVRRTGPPAGAGRWSLVAPLLDDAAPTQTEIAHARALQLLDRHGVLTREAVSAEGIAGGFSSVYGVLKALEDAGKIRRGYFVAGLGAAQFALPGAVDRLRSDDGERAVVVLAATDPAQPYGAALPWPSSSGKPSRAAGAYVVLVAGDAAVYLERGARALLTFAAAADPAWVDGLVALVKDGRIRRLEVGRIDSAPATESPAAGALRGAGFVEAYKGLAYRA